MTSLAGFGPLLRLAWRRDRVMILITTVVVFLLDYTSAIATLALYNTDAERILANSTANSSTAVISMYGRVYDVNSATGIGGTKLQSICFLTLAVLVIAIVRRHTRGEEETGRYELIGATPVGRGAPLAAAVALAAITSIVIGIGSGASLIVGGFPVTGSWYTAAAIAGVGLSLTGLTAIAVQLSSSYRTCGSFAFGALGVAFVLRMVGDLSEGKAAGVLTWLSPLGWSEQVRAYNGDRWWPVLLHVACLAGCLAIATVIIGRRDLGSGLVADRPGPATGTLGGAPALAWRLQRPALIGWLITFVLLGVMVGAIISTIGGFVGAEAEDLLRKMGGAGVMEDLYLSMVGGMSGLGAAAFGVASALRLRGEESSGHLENVLATPTTRTGFLGSHAAIAFVGSASLLLAMGLANVLAHGLTNGNQFSFGRDLGCLAVQIPAAWVLVAVTLVLIGWTPVSSSWGGWAVLFASLLLGEFGALLKLPSWVMEISPFAHTPKIPGEAMSWPPLLVMTLIAVVLTAVGAIGYRRRDMPVA